MTGSALLEKRKSGVLAPLFSVYSKDSCGIGDLGDLKLLLDWCAFTRNSILQLLPMNEVGSVYCPYDSLSSFALEPSYISLEKLPASSDRSIRIEIDNLKRNFPCGRGERVDYALKKEKLRILKAMYLRWDHSDSLELKRFAQENSYWLGDFALYKVLKDRYNGAAWYEWEDKYKNRDPLALEAFGIEHEEEVNFQMWVQWQLGLQFKAAKAYAESRDIALKGDLPILVSRDSADVWAHPQFFKLEFAAGAPPDMYCAKGQRWGMPTYKWDVIAADGYRYLKEKLKYAENFYHILRIDHVVGLFRIWSIPYAQPAEDQGLHGFFDPLCEGEWAGHGRSILSVMQDTTSMLLCAEDLGVIPRACPEALKDFNIPGNDVQRWVKDWKVAHDFLPAEEYRILSVAMLSTHDTTNWPAWWENEAGTVDEALFMRKCVERGIDYSRVKAELFDFSLSRRGRLRWKNEIASSDKLVWILGKRREEVGDFIELYDNSYREKELLWRHFGIPTPMREESDRQIVRAAFTMVLDSTAVFCINTIVDWLYLANTFKGDPYEHRINTPGTVSKFNWSLTIPLPLEDLLKNSLGRLIREMVISSARS